MRRGDVSEESLRHRELTCECLYFGGTQVETIGDCYVACTGIPEAQPDHAVIMVKFARDCLNKTAQITRELVDRLGPDTADLAMR